MKHTPKWEIEDNGRWTEMSETEFDNEPNLGKAPYPRTPLPERWTNAEEFSEDWYQPKTGERCHHAEKIMLDNCPICEGTGWKIDFDRIRKRNAGKFPRD